MSALTTLLGKNVIIGVIGIVIFLFTLRYSVGLFKWIEDQTFGTRDYIMLQMERLYIEIKPDHVTYLLLFISFGFGVIVFGIMAFMGKFIVGLILGVFLSFIGWKIPKPIINYIVKKRIAAYQDQLVDGLTLLSNGIRAGLSFPQAVGMVVDELKAPISQEFNMILQQNKIGVPLEECLENLKERLPLEDNEMFVTGVNILKETGGNLAETFDTIVFVIRERIRVKQKIDTYVAQGLMQGGTIFCMPTIMGIIYTLTDPDSMKPLFTHPLGLAMLVTAVSLNLIGGFFIWKVIQVKV